MAVFKCKSCGGALEITGKESVVTCEYCGSTQTLPRLDDERRVNLYDRANHFRRNNEFDKATAIFEQILNEDTKDAEAYWSLVLCRYGVVYVEDPATKKRVPTVNRAQFTSIFADENYKAALANADLMQKEIYEAEGKQIDEIQKGILAISQKEKPFDVFICYKETDENNQRTRDSVLANDLYHQLTQEGFKVFFSRITLEDKLGTAYEPYIFAALHSAQVMVVLGTKKEFFNAVWVKNEWSRFLAMIKDGEKKILIPAYRDMDPYDLPEEFSHLQAQDMSKLGFMQDLIRGIRKLVVKEEPKPAAKEPVTVNSGGGANTQALLKRAFMFLEDSDWKTADEYCDKVLDNEPENAQAYLGKLMAELHVSKQDALKNVAKPFDQNNHYKKVLRFADDSLAETMRQYIAQINERNELNRLNGIYAGATQKMRSASTDKEYREAADDFLSISHFKDAASLAEQCEENAKYAIYVNAVSGMNAKDENRILKSKKDFQKIRGYKDADVLAEQCDENANHVIYTRAVNGMNSNNENQILQAKRDFQKVSGYRDADALAEQCEDKLEKIRERIREQREQERLEKRRQEELERKREKSEKTKKRIKKICALSACVIVIAIVTWYVLTVYIPQSRYDEANKLLSEKNYAEAFAAFQKVPDYKDSQTKLEEIYNTACSILEQERYVEAYNLFKSFGSYRDAESLAQSTKEKMVQRTTIAAGDFHTVVVKKDGTVEAIGNNSSGQCNVSGWTDIVAVAAGKYHTVGLKSDGTVVAVGDDYGNACDVSEWTDIIAIAAGERNTFGLKADGTIVFAGILGKKATEWTNVVSIGALPVGLKADGTVITSGGGLDPNVSDWKNIVSIASASNHVVGIKTDGTVVAKGSNTFGVAFHDESIESWKNIVAVSTGDSFVAGLTASGKVVLSASYNHGFDILGWTDIVEISAGYGHLVALRANGTVVATGNNEDGQCDVSKWKDVLVP